MTTIVKFPGVIYGKEDGSVDYDIHPDFWDIVSQGLSDAGFKPGDDIVITFSKTE